MEISIIPAQEPARKYTLADKNTTHSLSSILSSKNYFCFAGTHGPESPPFPLPLSLTSECYLCCKFLGMIFIRSVCLSPSHAMSCVLATGYAM